MKLIKAVAGASLVVFVALGLAQKYNDLSTLARTPPPDKELLADIQLETRPQRTLAAAIAEYQSGSEAEKRVHLANLLATVDSPAFDGVKLDVVTAEALSRAVVAGLPARVDGEPDDVELRRRAAGFLAGRVPGKTSRDFVLKALEDGPAEVRLEALKRVGSPSGVRGRAVFAMIQELGERGLVPDEVYPAALRRTGGLKAKDGLVAIFTSTDSRTLINGCAISLQDYHDPELIGTILERLEQVGMIDSTAKLPWLSASLLNEHLKSADKAALRRGMIAISVRPSLGKLSIEHVEKGLQSPDPDTRRYAAVAVKKAVVAQVIEARQGENLLAGRLQVETEPVLKAELTGGLERIHSLLGRKVTGVQ